MNMTLWAGLKKGYGEQKGLNATVNGVNIGSWTLERDDAGRIVTKTETVLTETGAVATDVYDYQYDDAGRLIEYVHDPLGRRIAKKIGGAIVEKYLWQGRTQTT